MDSLPNKKNLVPISEAAKVLGVSIDTVRRWDKSGSLHSERPDGKNRYFSLDELEEYKLKSPLSISDVAKKFNISATTLRRLEARGLIKPSRNSAGERVYNQDLLKNFLNSDYFLRKKQITEKELTNSAAPENENKNENEPAIPPINLKPRPRSWINEFMSVSIITFALLVTFGIRNIWITEYNNAKALATTTTSEVLSAKKEVKSETLPETKPEATPEAKLKTKVKVKTDGSPTVNIRQKPTTNSAKIGQAKDGESFEFISKDSAWFEIKLASGSAGFISSKYVMEVK